MPNPDLGHSEALADYPLLSNDQEAVIFQLAMCGPLPVEKIRDYSGVKGRPLGSALTGLRRRGLAWRGVSGAWHTTEAGYLRGRA